MNIIQLPSPNFDSRDGQAVDMLVLHYTGMRGAAAALDRMIEAEAKVSAHYVVDEEGGVYQLVDESMRAWHAGKSFWRGATNINQRSIGVEIVNPGHEWGYRPFPKAQMQAVAELCKAIIARHNIPAHNIVGHSDVAPTRKDDPGELFDWKWLAEQGVGVWPYQDSGFGIQDSATGHWSLVTDNLSSYGYDTTDMAKTITAFQRRFRPSSLSGQWDSECEALLSGLNPGQFTKI